MTKRVFLRPFKKSDAPALLRWGQNKYYQRLAGFGRYQNLAEAEKAAEQYAARKYSYAVCLQSSGQVIGLAELYERGTNEKELLSTKEVGFLLDHDFSGHGYMTEALTLLFDYAFRELKQTEIWAGTFKQNQLSQKLLKRLGFNYIYSADLSQISTLFNYEEKYYLLKKNDWLSRTK